MEVVLVHWQILPERAEDFEMSRMDLTGKPGFLGETLYRSVVEDTSATAYLNVGRWSRREDFYRALEIEPGSQPEMLPFEARPRRREWLVFVVEDTDPAASR